MSDYFATLWTVAHQAPLSMGFPRQEYWRGLPFPSPGDLPHPGIEPGSLSLQADALTYEPPGKQEQLDINGVSGRWNKLSLPTQMAKAFYQYLWEDILRFLCACF